MGRYQSPLVKHDLSRLEDPEGRQIALTSLKNCVRNLEPECIAFFLDQIGEAHQNSPRPYIISLYEDIARAHRSLLVPYIPRIMEALISTLSESASSLHIHESCSKVVASLAKHSIDMGRMSHQAKEVLRLLCEPLLCVVVGKFQPVSAGAAVCLTALVESENWSHAPKELVHEVCFRVVAAVSGKSATVAHVQLAVAAARVNRGVVEGFGVELLVSGREILDSATSWNLRVAAAQLLNSALTLVDGVALAPEIASVLDVLERHRLDRMPKVRSSVGEALKTARACCSSLGGATTKMFFSVGDNRRVDPGIGSILMPGFQGEYSSRSSGKRDPRPKAPSVVSRNQRLRKGGGGGVRPPPPEETLGVEFVIVEEQGQSPRRSGRRGGESSRVRHTISAEPGGYVIQEWIKVDDRFPGCGILAGIDEGEEYFESPEFYPAMSPGERQVVIFDEDHVANTRLIETELATIPEEPAAAVVSSCSTSSCLLQQPQGDRSFVLESSTEVREEWSVRDNPIAVKSEEIQGRSPRAEEEAPQADESGAPEQLVRVEERTTTAAAAEESPEVKLADIESSLDSAASIDGSFIKMNASEELVDAFRRNWEVLESGEEQSEESVLTGPGGREQLVKAISSSFIEEDSPASTEIVQSQEEAAGLRRRNSIRIWRKIQSSMEKLLAGSLCAALLLPASMALIKCLEQNSIDMVPT